MNKRLAQFIDYKTGGNQKEFALLMGWSPQYLHKMLKGDSMGIQPVVSLLQKFPELDARWLILGDGAMIDVRSRILGMLTLEKYIPVMNREEIDALSAGRTDFDDDTIEGWKVRLEQKESEMRQRFDTAYMKQSQPAGESGFLAKNS